MTYLKSLPKSLNNVDSALRIVYEKARARGKTHAEAMRIMRTVEKRKASATKASAVSREAETKVVYSRQPEALTLRREIESIIGWTIEKQEGYRIGFVGESGGGKTSAIKLFVKYPFNGITLIHDEKPARQSQFVGTVDFVQSDIVSIDALRGHKDMNTIVFRGDPWKRTVTRAHDVAELAIKLAQRNVPVRLVIDELDSATTDGGMKLASTAVRYCLTQGRAMNISVLCSTQLPSRMPPEVFDNLSALVLVRCGAKSLLYLKNRANIDDYVLQSVGTLKAHYESADSGPGEVIVIRAGKGWDGRILRNA